MYGLISRILAAIMKDSILFIIGKRVLCTMTLGLGVVMLSVSSVAEANAAKMIGKIVSKTRPIPIPKPTPKPRIGGNNSSIPWYGPARVVTKEIERRRREEEEKKSPQKGWFNW